jgi:hypothetical protein
MKTAKRDYRKTIMSYVEGLAEAIVLHQSSHLDINEATPDRQERTLQKMKNLLTKEQKKECSRK